jgi:hypothetical protein
MISAVDIGRIFMNSCNQNRLRNFTRKLEEHKVGNVGLDRRIVCLLQQISKTSVRFNSFRIRFNDGLF